jgi:hypothetical protein
MRATLAAALVVASGGFAVTAVSVAPAHALDNGLALTPPMGWNDWNAYGCNVSASLVEQTAAYLASSGMKAAGYEYVNIDDCWMSKSRDAAGNLVPDPTKFPNGIKAVADYVHQLGLKLGIYESAGTATCAGYPGSLGHETQDAATFASWGVDYLKYDNCNNQGIDYQQRYNAMRDALTATGRPIVYSLCEWGNDNVWTWGTQTGNLWRTTGDIGDSFGSMLNNFHQNVTLAQYAGPGHWNDPDMLEIGNGGMSVTEEQSEFSLWAEMAAPLVAGTNLAAASAATMSIYTNKNVIAVDQDSLGKQGTEISASGGLDVLTKPLANGDVSVVLFNENSTPATISTTASAAGLGTAPAYRLDNLWTKAATETAGTISATVPAHGVVMYQVSPLSGSGNLAPATSLLSSINPADAAYTSGAPVVIGETFTNDGVDTVNGVSLTVRTTAGWKVRPVGRTSFGTVKTGASVTAYFTLSPGKPSAPITASTATGTATYRWRGGPLKQISTSTAHLTTPVAAPYHTFSSTTGYYGQLGGALAIAGDGADTYGSTDEYSAIYEQGAMTSTSTAVVEVTHQDATNDWAKAGLMVRDDITGAGKSPGYAILVVTPGNGYALQWDSGGTGQLDTNSSTGTVSYPSWLKLVRSGGTVTGYYSTDDTTWNLVGSATLPGTTTTQDVGVYMTAHQAGTIGEADFQGFAVN